MLNTSKIRERMVQLGISDKEVAAALNLSIAVTVKKLNNICILNLMEAEELAGLLQISGEAFSDYFLHDVLHNATIGEFLNRKAFSAFQTWVAA